MLETQFHAAHSWYLSDRQDERMSVRLDILQAAPEQEPSLLKDGEQVVRVDATLVTPGC